MSKILTTIGPATESYKSLKKIIKFTKVLRLNGAHGKISWHKKISKNIKKIDNKSEILLDLPGVKPRLNISHDINIKINELVLLSNKPFKTSLRIKKLPLTNSLPRVPKKSRFLSINDGKYKFKILKKNKKSILAKSLQNCILEPKKGINIPFSIYNENLQKKIYFKFLKKAKNIKYNAIGLSYVQSPKIIKDLKTKYKNTVIVSKIENIEGLNKINEIAKISDAIMIDRGDLSAEIGENKLFSAIEKISKFTKQNGLPLIMATENLESMTNKSKILNPSKSEIVSLSYSISLGADKIMLSEETAVSDNWENIINWMNNFLKNKKTKKNKDLNKGKVFWNAIKNLNNMPIVCFSKKGYALDKIRSSSNTKSLTVFTESKITKSKSAFSGNTSCFLTAKFPKRNIDLFIYKSIKKKKKQIFNLSKNVALIYVAYPRKNSRANTLSIISEQDFK